MSINIFFKRDGINEFPSLTDEYIEQYIKEYEDKDEEINKQKSGSYKPSTKHQLIGLEKLLKETKERYDKAEYVVKNNKTYFNKKKVNISEHIKLYKNIVAISMMNVPLNYTKNFTVTNPFPEDKMKEYTNPDDGIPYYIYHPFKTEEFDEYLNDLKKIKYLHQLLKKEDVPTRWNL